MIHTLTARNVCTLYPRMCDVLAEHGVWQDSRGGKVLVLQAPMLTCVTHPRERVLFSSIRDANPFFHVAESIWMLAGQRNARWLDQYVKNFSERFGEPEHHIGWANDKLGHINIREGDINGAYGYRWRHHFDTDQLVETVSRLSEDPLDRRVVIGMWDPDHDYSLKDLNDYPCNTHIYPRIVDGALDLTVCCRSNDAIWGALGANIFHFSFVQEWLALAIGVPMGRLYQFSNNYHVYEKIWARCKDFDTDNAYEIDDVYPEPIVITDPGEFLVNCERVFDNVDEDDKFRSAWFIDVWIPLRDAHRLYKEGFHVAAMRMADQIAAPDLRLACRGWLLRRMKVD